MLTYFNLRGTPPFLLLFVDTGLLYVTSDTSAPSAGEARELFACLLILASLISGIFFRLAAGLLGSCSC